MNKFIGILIVQNLIILYLILFIPVSIFFDVQHDYSLTTYFLLILFFIFVLLLLYLNNFLIENNALSFGFLRFIPFIFLMHKFNSLLKKYYPDLTLKEYQKQIIIVYLMNKHVLITEEDYFHFSRSIKIPRKEGNAEFLQMIESTPFFYELHEYSDQYSIDQELLAEQGLLYNEGKFALVTILGFLFYILLIVIIFLM